MHTLVDTEMRIKSFEGKRGENLFSSQLISDGMHDKQSKKVEKQQQKKTLPVPGYSTKLLCGCV